ncbi:MAG: hypothetical protein RJA70_2466 [Pseudomonadota bacterium]|jgi:general secretion pathway protein C
MAFDTLIKKFFPLIVGLVIALIAYFQSSGVVELVAMGQLGIQPSEVMAEGLKPGGAAAAPPVRPSRSAEAIIARNPFDHLTDLNPKPIEAPAVPEPPKTVDLSDPLAAAECAGVTLLIVTESPDPQWSAAIVKGTKDAKGMLRRVGDRVDDAWEIVYIGFNRVNASPAVWMVDREKTLCQASLFKVEGAPTAAAAAVPETPEAAPAAPPAVDPALSRGAPAVPEEIKSQIERVSETEFNVNRSVVDNILENSTQLMRSARIVPEKGADGKTVGIRLFGVRPDTLLGTLGLENGDRLETINGFNMASPEDALNAYARLRSANKLAVKVTRRGKPMNIDFNIK